MNKKIISITILMLVTLSLIPITQINIDTAEANEQIDEDTQLGTPGIYNSEGYYSSTLTSATVQTAINDLGTNGGTVWVNGDITHNSQIILKTRVIVDFMGNQINVNSNNPVITLKSGTFNSVVRGATIQLPTIYTKSVFYLDINLDGEWSDSIFFNTIENFEVFGSTSRNYVGIHIHLDSSASSWNDIFRNIKLHNPDTGIKLEMTENALPGGDDGTPGYGNGNCFDNILIDSFRHGIEFIKPSDFSWAGFNCNDFNNIKMIYCSDSQYGITGVFSNGNQFYDITMEGWESYPSVEKVYQIGTPNYETKLYVDEWQDFNSKFESNSGVTVLETGCYAKDFTINHESYFLDVDYNNRGVHNSNGNFWSTATSSSIQAAINDLAENPGTVIVNAPATISSSIQMKSNVKLDFCGYNVNINSGTNGFVYTTGTQNTVLRNCKLAGISDGYSYVLMSNSGSSDISYNLVENLIFNGGHFRGIHLKIDSLAGIWSNTFRDIHFGGGDGIYLEMTNNGIGSGDYGWANGNVFEYFCYDNFYKGMVFNIPSSVGVNDEAGFNCNLFKHFLFQIEGMSEDGMINICGDSNTFIHVIYWDGAVSYFYEITSKAKNTKIWADWWNQAGYTDNGLNTVIQDGPIVYDPSSFNWGSSGPGPVNNPPYTPNTPLPTHGSVIETLTPTLEWKGGDPDSEDTVTYDVYFEVNDPSPDILVSNDQTSTSYMTNILVYDTDYYWKIIAEDNHGLTSSSTVWHFKTMSEPTDDILDQEQNQNDGYLVLYHPGMHAQSFIPTLDTLTRVKLLITKTGSPEDISIGIRENLNEPNIVSIKKTASEIPYGLQWVEFDFTDITVKPGSTYYITIYTSTIGPENNYQIGEGWQTSYLEGIFHNSRDTGETWDDMAVYDLCFKTYGIDQTENNPPYEPMIQNPTNGQMNVDINTVLEWVGGDPDIGDTVTYDIYFGKTNNPVLIESNHETNTYSPGSLEYDTHYYWKIVARDNHGAETVGDVWEFTTESEPTVYYTLTVNVDGSGSVDPSGGTYVEDTVVSLTATPDSGWVFSHWSGDLFGVSNPADITMDADKSVTAVFTEEQPNYYTLSTDVVGGGSVDPSSGTYLEGTWIPVTALADTGWVFSHWGGDLSGDSNPAYLQMNSDKSVTAIFEPDTPGNNPPYDPIIQVPVMNQNNVPIDTVFDWVGGDPDEGDTVTYDFYLGTNSDPPIVATELTQTLYYPTGTMEYDTHYYWKIVARDNHGAETVGDVWEFNTESEPTVYYTLTVNVDGSGSVDPSGGTYVEDTVVSLTATPDSGWVFSHWSGDLFGSNNPEDIVMNSDKIVTAVFTEQTVEEYTLSVTIFGSGTVIPMSGTYAEGTMVTLIANAESGWMFDSWDGDLTGSENPADIIMNSDKVVTAVFVENQNPVNYTLTTNVDGHGTITADPDQDKYQEGTVVTLTAVPDDGYLFYEWSGDVADMYSETTTITMDSDKTVTATFIKKQAENITIRFDDYYIGFVDVNVQNNAEEDYQNIKWNMSVVGGILQGLDEHNNGTIGLLNSTESTKIGTEENGISMRFGFVEIKINFIVGDQTYMFEADGFVIGKFIIVI